MSEVVKKIQAMDKPQRVSISPEAGGHGVLIRVDYESECRALRVSIHCGDTIETLAEETDHAGRTFYRETTSTSVAAKDFKAAVRAMLLGLLGEIPVVIDEELLSGPAPEKDGHDQDQCDTEAPRSPVVMTKRTLTQAHTLLAALLADPSREIPAATIVPALEDIRHQLKKKG